MNNVAGEVARGVLAWGVIFVWVGRGSWLAIHVTSARLMARHKDFGEEEGAGDDFGRY